MHKVTEDCRESTHSHCETHDAPWSPGAAVCEGAGATVPRIGSLVEFREGARPYAANVGIRYVVVESPTAEGWSVDNTGPAPRAYVWLVDARDTAKPPSRQRRRSGYVTDLLEVTPVSLEARCETCGETFNPDGEDDLVHLSRHDDTECGGQGVITGGWF